MYRAPIEEQLFVLETVAGLPNLAADATYAGLSIDLANAVLRQSATLAEDVFAPLNRPGDLAGTVFENGTVVLPAGFDGAYRTFVDGGWAAMAAQQTIGGQGLPLCLAHAVNEQLTSANAALSGCFQLSWGATELLTRHADPWIATHILPRLVDGRWTGTMNMTEPQAGSDVGAIRTVARPREDGSYLIKGEKIFISFGDHDLAENIIHLVLARTPDAPAGSKGLSLFAVPKWRVGHDGAPGPRNDVHCIAVEHKLGMRASPTCVMRFGDADGCVGHLVGAEGAGIATMFVMMNNARINVGVQGLALAETARQMASTYARERIQSRAIGGSIEPVPIVRHPDVRRMLLTQRALTEGVRGLIFFTAGTLDRARADDSAVAASAQGLADLLTPVAKAYATDTGMEVISSALQVFGGYGFIEETGIAQLYRDVRITPIYEGTNGIQALDLVQRKLSQGDGCHWRRLFDEFDVELCKAEADPSLQCLAEPVRSALAVLRRVTAWLAARQGTAEAASGATPYLRMFGTVAASAILVRQAAAARRMAGNGAIGQAFSDAKLTTARFHAAQLLPAAVALEAPIMDTRDLVDCQVEAVV